MHLSEYLPGSCTANMSTHRIDRRDFVKVVTAFLGTVMTAIIGLPAIGYLVSPAVRSKETDAWIPLGPLKNYPVGGTPTPFSFNRTSINGWEKTVSSYRVFVVRPDNDQLLVLSNICTHLSCVVSWHPDIQHYVSPCHDGHFDLVGQVLKGPPPRPLDEYTTKIENGELSILFPPFKRVN